jgi:predicted MFS family arabinose efflux permease
MKEKLFSKYQVFIIALLSVLQFTIVLDFVVLSPLGAQLMQELKLTTSQFGLAVSVYAFSAGISGLLAAGFADKFDRKKLLLFFYAGFIIGTFLCGIAPNYEFLLGARIITGLFGGVIGAVSFAIITDLFKMEVRGRVMGFVQMSFSASQVLGIPVGLYLANKLGWHSPFLMISSLSVIVGIGIIIYLQPLVAHLKIQSDKNPFLHLYHTISKPTYSLAFAVNIILITGGFMLMPFGSAYSIHNLGLTMAQLPILYMATGIFSLMAGPLIGKFSDVVGKYKIFCIGSGLAIFSILIYCNLGVTPLSIVILLNTILMVGILSRMISISALMTAIPEPADRGAFMSINSSVQQISGGIASIIAGLIVVQTANGTLKNYNILGYIVVSTILITIGMMYFVNQFVNKKTKAMAAARKMEDMKLSVAPDSEETMLPESVNA